MFFEKNFKEFFSDSSGDNLSYIFILGDKLEILTTVGDDHEHYLYISSKIPKTWTRYRNEFFLEPIRFQPDSNELFPKIYFGKYDNVFEEGSPFEEMEDKLDIYNKIIYHLVQHLKRS